jgi:hypothetical protein
MEKDFNPWDIAYEELKDHYTKEQINEMALCELEEILSYEE